jgi:hypothetical protein
MHSVLLNNFRVPRHGFPRFLAVLEVLYFQQSVNFESPSRTSGFRSSKASACVIA